MRRLLPRPISPRPAIDLGCAVSSSPPPRPARRGAEPERELDESGRPGLNFEPGGAKPQSLKRGLRNRRSDAGGLPGPADLALGEGGAGEGERRELQRQSVPQLRHIFEGRGIQPDPPAPPFFA